MKILKPYYYNKFKCIGGACPNTCCKGWKITIDEESLSLYQKVGGEFGKKLMNNIECSDNLNLFKLNHQSRCPFLNQDKLCDIYINLGETYMCHTCKVYPRITKIRSDIVEQTLTLSCPEVAKLLIDSKEAIDFEFGDIEECNVEPEQVNDKLFNCLIHVRTLFVDILQMKQIKFLHRQLLLLIIADKIQGFLNDCNYEEIESVINYFYNEEILKLYIEQFENIQKNTDAKVNFIEEFLKKIFSDAIVSDNYIAKLYNQCINNNPEITIDELLRYYEENFDKYYEHFSYVYENFYVHTIFRYSLDALSDSQILKQVILTNLGYIIIHFFDTLSWFDNDYNLTEENQCLIMGAFSLLFEHNTSNFENVYNFLASHNLTSLAFQAVLLN